MSSLLGVEDRLDEAERRRRRVDMGQYDVTRRHEVQVYRTSSKGTGTL